MLKKKVYFLSAALLLAACGGEDVEEDNVDQTEETTDTQDTENENDGNGETTGDGVVIRVASQTTPMTDVVEIAAEVIEGYEIELVEVSDNVQFNEALAHGEVDANFAQHAVYMEIYNENTGSNLVDVQPIYDANVGYFSSTLESLDQLEEGAEVAIPSDPPNEARALLILEDYDLITLDDVDGVLVSVDDIADNPYDLQFTHVDLLQLTEAYQDEVYDLVFNYPTYIAQIGLYADDALFLEQDSDHTFAIQLVATEENQDSPEIQALIEAFTSEEVAEFLSEFEEQGHLDIVF